MTVTLSTGRTVKLHWVHSSHNNVTREGAGAQRQMLDDLARTRGRRLSMCEVSQVDEGEYATLGQGIAMTHPNDTFRKDLGRKHSLGKALVAASLTRAERDDVWAAFKAQFGIVSDNV